MKKIILLLLLVIYIPLLNGISLNEVIKKSIKKDTKSKNLSIQKKLDILNAEIARKRKFFNINLKASYLYKSENMEIVFPPTVVSPTFTVPGKTMIGGVKNNFDLNLSIIQPIYSGGIISNNIKLKENDINSTENEKIISSLELEDKIKTSYFTYLIIIEELKATATLYDELELHDKKVKNLYTEKLIGRDAVLETDMKRNEIILILLNLKNKADEEKHRFKYLTGMDLNSVDNSYKECVLTIDKSLEYFLNNHPFLSGIKLNKEKLEINRKIIKGNYTPQINGFFELHYGKPGIDFFKAEWSPYIQAGIGLSYRVFDWNEKKSKLSAIDYMLKKLDNKKGELIKITKKSLNTLYLKKKILKIKEEKLDELIKFSKEMKDLKSKLFFENQISNLEYMSFLQKLKRYKISKIKNKYNIELIKTKINTIIGR